MRAGLVPSVLLTLQTEIVSHSPELVLVRPHLALRHARFFRHTRLVRVAVCKFLLHIPQTVLDPLLSLFEIAIALLNCILLRLIQALYQALSILLHAANLLLELLLLLASAVGTEAFALCGLRHIARHRAGLLHRPVTRPILIALLTRRLLTKPLALHGPGLILGLAASLTRCCLPSALARASGRTLSLPLAPSSTAATTLRHCGHWSQA